jgi:hypothetical protein
MKSFSDVACVRLTLACRSASLSSRLTLYLNRLSVGCGEGLSLRIRTVHTIRKNSLIDVSPTAHVPDTRRAAWTKEHAMIRGASQIQSPISSLPDPPAWPRNIRRSIQQSVMALRELKMLESSYVWRNMLLFDDKVKPRTLELQAFSAA